ncbi:MAG: hypothetical protein U1E65_28315 [Myxococcota bacterium]
MKVQLSLLVLGAAAIITGCPSTDVEPRDATTAVTDTGVVTPDAGTMDAGPADLGTADLGVDAGEAVDSGGMDASDPCGTVPRAQAGAALSAAVSRLAQRCYPEIAGWEADAIAARAGVALSAALEDPAVNFDADLAGRCNCDLETVSCDEPEPLQLLASCRNVLSGTVAVGAACLPNRCVRGAVCNPPYPDAPAGCWGTCTTTVAEGQECATNTSEVLPCTPGTYCEIGKGSSCQPKARRGESCSFRPCVGETASPLFPRMGCRTSSVGSTCQPLGREGAACDLLNCDALYRCDDNTSTCHLRPTRGDRCILPVDTATPTGKGLFINLSDGRVACRVNPENSIGGDLCVQTGSTSGVATCTAIPSLGEACGVGRNLPWMCAPGSYCAGIDPNQLSPVMSTCAPTIAASAPCDISWDPSLLGPECAVGSCVSGEPSVCAIDLICVLD